MRQQTNLRQLFWIVAALCLLAAFKLWGQANSLLTETVVDPSGAVVANAEVVCRNSQTGVVTTRTTNAEWLFRFPDLPIGEYELSVISHGFDTLTRKGILRFLKSRPWLAPGRH